jgi:peroxiredoxin Q/BCP
METTDFGRRAGEFAALNTQIIGVSVDDPAEQQKHAVACGANFPLLSDQGGKLAQQLGILSDRGVARRTTYVVDKDGVIRKIFEDVKVDGHTGEVLAAVRELAA